MFVHADWAFSDDPKPIAIIHSMMKNRFDGSQPEM
jgi:hypothetical protein